MVSRKKFKLKKNLIFTEIFFLDHSAVWKNAKFSHRIFFRENSSLVISIVKTLVSRYFCQKCVRVNFRNFHTVELKLRKSSLSLFWQKFHESNVPLKKLLKSWFDELLLVRDFSTTGFYIKITWILQSFIQNVVKPSISLKNRRLNWRNIAV